MCGGDDNSAVQNTQKRVIPGKNGGTLTPFMPGNKANPGGRPKKDYSAVIAVRAFELLQGDEPNGSKLDQSASNIAEVIEKNPKMFQVISDRGFGKVPQTLNLTGELSVSNIVADRLRAARKRVKS